MVLAVSSPSEGNGKQKPARPVRFRRLKRALKITAIAFPVLVLLLWIAIHRIVWLGPLLADTARAILGPGPVAWIENTTYAIDDWVRQKLHGDEAPEAYWDVPSAVPQPLNSTPPPAVSASARGDDPPAPPPFRPADVGAIHKAFAAAGDGVWLPIDDPEAPREPPRMFKTLLHPDRNRSWTVVAIVAIDMKRARLHLVAGTREPEALEPEGKELKREGIIPAVMRHDLIAAFNGGFKTVHGRYGMRIDGITIIKPRKDACTVALYKDGTLKVAAWKSISGQDESSFEWWRQTPGCFVDEGKMHAGLTVEDNTYWGAAIGGNTVIRRSALGMSEDGRTLFVGIGDFTTAPAIAKAMAHAGAHSVAQLDVNWSFPRFLIYVPKDGDTANKIATPLCKGFEFTEDEYIRESSPRDFFYLTRAESQ